MSQSGTPRKYMVQNRRKQTSKRISSQEQKVKNNVKNNKIQSSILFSSSIQANVITRNRLGGKKSRPPPLKNHYKRFRPELQ